MNRLTPWFEQTKPAPPVSGGLREDLLAATRILRFDMAIEPEPTPLDRTPSGGPLSILLPTPYEPRYAYPLVVWLHGDGADETELHDVLPAISEQNFVGAAPRAEYGRWDPANVDEWSNELHDLLVDLRRTYHVHSERIFLAGRGSGAAMAIATLLHRPTWFAGALALTADVDLGPGSLSRFHELRGKRVLLASSTSTGQSANGLVAALRNATVARQLRAAGIDVTLHTHDAPEPLGTDLLRETNRWLVDAACAVV